MDLSKLKKLISAKCPSGSTGRDPDRTRVPRRGAETSEKSINDNNILPDEKKLKSLMKGRPYLLVRNSFCELNGFPEAVYEFVAEALTYKNEQVEQEKLKTFRLLRMARSKGNKRMEYALKAQLVKLDAQETVCWLRDGKVPTGHLNIVRDLLDGKGIGYEIDDQRKVPEPEYIFRWQTPPDPPRYYQEEMHRLGVTQTRGVFESAVGTGKTLILARLLQELAVTSLVILPSSALLEQTRKNLERWFGRKYVQVVTSQVIKKDKELKAIRLCTVQTLASLQKHGLAGKLLQDVHLIAVDEIHHAGAKSYTDLLPELDHVYYRFGFTGTFLRNDSKTLDMWGFLSNRLYYYPPYKATEEGFLTPVELRVVTLEGSRSGDYQKEYDKNYLGKPMILQAIVDILDKIPRDQQVLILVDRKDKAGAIIHKYLANLGVEATYISGDDSKEDIGEAIERFNEKEIRILIGSTVIGEGVDVHSTQHLILARGGKSEVALVQAIGRCVRLHPGKDRSYVYDFRFEGTRFLEKHFQQRLDVFKNQFAGEVRYL